MHLVWAPLGTDPLRRFLESYTRHSAGVEHRLVILLNGFLADQDLTPWRRALEHASHEELRLRDPMQDVAAYRRAVECVDAPRYCFLNSYSEILADDWLAKFTNALEQPRAGLVGATGFWASMRSATLNGLMLPNAYRGVVPGRRAARAELSAIEASGSGGMTPDGDAPAERSLQQSIRATLRTLRPVPERLLRFEGFPAPHLRTNGFIVTRDTFSSISARSLDRKMDAHRLESGRDSLTRQVQRLGLRALVIDRDGAVYEHEDWPASRTLWQCDQDGLLVADNQTRLYAEGAIERRRLLSAFAWGQHADPRMPAHVS